MKCKECGFPILKLQSYYSHEDGTILCMECFKKVIYEHRCPLCGSNQEKILDTYLCPYCNREAYEDMLIEKEIKELEGGE